MRSVIHVFARVAAGQALAEMILVVPLFLLLFVGVVEFGRYMYMSVLVGNAARAGVQYGAQNLITAADSTGMANAATVEAESLPNFNAGTPAYFCTCPDGTSVSCIGTCSALSNPIMYVSVTTSAALQVVTPQSLLTYVGVPSNLRISNTAIMRVLQ